MRRRTVKARPVTGLSARELFVWQVAPALAVLLVGAALALSGAVMRKALFENTC